MKNRDKNIFEDGWDHINAYVFGLIMSDGCLLKEGRNKNRLNVRLALNDRDMIEYLHKYLECGNKIYEYKNSLQLRYRNCEAVDFMMQYGLTERKSLTLSYPDIPSEYMPDFIRGYFDGNGSVIMRETPYNTYSQISFTSGSTIFLEGLKQQLLNNNIYSHLYTDERVNKKAWYLRIIKYSEISKLFNYLYHTSECDVYLLRKYSKFEEAVSYELKYKSHIA